MTTNHIQESYGTLLVHQIKGAKPTPTSFEQRAANLLNAIAEKAFIPINSAVTPLATIGEHLAEWIDDDSFNYEYFTDACNDIERAFKDENWGDNCFNTLPRFTRDNLFDWLDMMRVLFNTLDSHFDLSATKDYYWLLRGLDNTFNTQAEKEKTLAEFEQKYLPVQE